jgi:hypothetical protein
MSKCNVIDSIGKLRILREKLCDQEKTWLNDALDERERVIIGLEALRVMILEEDCDIDECQKKIEEILCCLSVDLTSRIASSS